MLPNFACLSNESFYMLIFMAVFDILVVGIVRKLYHTDLLAVITNKTPQNNSHHFLFLIDIGRIKF